MLQKRKMGLWKNLKDFAKALSLYSKRDQLKQIENNYRMQIAKDLLDTVKSQKQHKEMVEEQMDFILKQLAQTMGNINQQFTGNEIQRQQANQIFTENQNRMHQLMQQVDSITKNGNISNMNRQDLDKLSSSIDQMIEKSESLEQMLLLQDKELAKKQQEIMNQQLNTMSQQQKLPNESETEYNEILQKVAKQQYTIQELMDLKQNLTTKFEKLKQEKIEIVPEEGTKQVMEEHWKRKLSQLTLEEKKELLQKLKKK